MAESRRPRTVLTSAFGSLALVVPLVIVPVVSASAAPVTVTNAADLVNYLGSVDDYEITLGVDITITADEVVVEGAKTLDLGAYDLTTKSIRLADGAELTITALSNTSRLYAAAHDLPGKAGIDTRDGKLTVLGGSVAATGGTDAAGIGGGSGRNNGHLIVYGGDVAGVGGMRGAGIGGGYAGGGGTIELFGGWVAGHGGPYPPSTLDVPSATGGAGIGGGNSGASGSILIDGATVVAFSGAGGAGIGGGYLREFSDITIESGDVTATGRHGGAGIGGGSSHLNPMGDGGTILINGGSVHAIGLPAVPTLSVPASPAIAYRDGHAVETLTVASGATLRMDGGFGASDTGEIGTISIAGTLTSPTDPIVIPAAGVVTVAVGGAIDSASSLEGDGTIDNHGVITNSTVASTLTVTDHNYLVTFDPDPVTPTSSVRVYAPTFSSGFKSFPADPTRAGFSFNGWLDGTSPFTSTTELTGDTTVTADWVSHYALSPLASAATAGTPVTFTVVDTSTTPAADVTTDFTFSSDDSATAFPDSAVTATLAGTRTITAQHDTLADVTLSTTLTVTPAALDPSTALLSITPAAITAGGSATVIGTGTDAYGNAISDVAGLFSYQSSNPSDTIVGSTVTATAAGTRTITATLGGHSIPLNLDVNPDAPADLEIDLGVTTVNVGDTITVTVHTIDAHGNQVSDVSGSVTLTSSHATDEISGNTVRFPSASVHTITATLGALSASADVTVLAASLSGTGVDPTLAVLLSLSLTLLGGALTLGRLQLSRPPRRG